MCSGELTSLGCILGGVLAGRVSVISALMDAASLSRAVAPVYTCDTHCQMVWVSSASSPRFGVVFYPFDYFGEYVVASLLWF